MITAKVCFKEVSEKLPKNNIRDLDYTDFRKITQIFRRRFNLCNPLFNQCNHEKRLFQGSTKKGQSLIELAIFSTVIFLVMGALVSYALSYNHNQRATMMVAKRARQLADEVASTSLSASVALVYDKAVASLSSMFGIPKRVPVVASSSAVRSNDLYSEMDGVDEELPRVVYDINGKVYTLKTAALVTTKSFTEDDAKRKAWIDGWNGEGQAWHWEYPGGDENKFDNGTAWDIDGDEEEEVIVALAYISETIVDKDGVETTVETCVGGLVMDSQDGELDMTEPNPALQNGLLSDIYTSEYNQSQLRNTQQSSQFQTITSIYRGEIVERLIRLNPNYTGSMDNIEDQISNNNSGCDYSGGFSCSLASVGRDCDCIHEYDSEENGLQRFIVVRSVFSTDKDAYVWSRDE